MIQFLLVLLGLAFPDNNTPVLADHPNSISTDRISQISMESDTSGDEGQTPKK